MCKLKILKTLDQGHLHPKLEVQDMSWLGTEPGPLRWVTSTLGKSHLNSFVNSYSEHLHMSARPRRTWFPQVHMLHESIEVLY
jgi:hypothetical protein